MGAVREIKIIGRNGSYRLSVYVDEEDYRTTSPSQYIIGLKNNLVVRLDYSEGRA